jgi:hypothetical protein
MGLFSKDKKEKVIATDIRGRTYCRRDDKPGDGNLIVIRDERGRPVQAVRYDQTLASRVGNGGEA